MTMRGAFKRRNDLQPRLTDAKGCFFISHVKRLTVLFGPCFPPAPGLQTGAIFSWLLLNTRCLSDRPLSRLAMYSYMRNMSLQHSSSFSALGCHRRDLSRLREQDDTTAGPVPAVPNPPGYRSGTS
jgi:hypothetical protein